MFGILSFLLTSSALAYNQSDLVFYESYFSYRDPPTQQYSIISCRKSEDVKFGKMISGTLNRFVTFHEADVGLEIPANEMTTFVLNVFCSNWMNILRQVPKRNISKFVINISTIIVLAATAMAKSLGLYRKPFQWLLIGVSEEMEEKNVDEVWNFLGELPLLVDSDFNIATKGEEEKFEVVSLYKISYEGDVIREYLAEWRPKTQLKILNSESIAMRRWNLQGLTMPATLVITDPDSLNHMEDLVDRHKDTTSKVTFNFIKLMEHIFNLSLSYRIDQVWGVPLENGSWTGMMGDLQRGEIVLGASPLFFASERLKLVEFYAMVTPTKVRFIFISPPLSHSSNIFSLPFAGLVWICCLITFVIACLSLFIALSIEENQEETKGATETSDENPSSQLRKTFSLSDIIVYNIGAICQQGTVAQTYKPAGRIITFFTYISYMFLYISYSASIVAILQSSDTSIQTLFDLLKSPMKAGADDVAYSQYYFKTADDDLRKMFYESKIHPNKKEPPNFFSPEVGIKKVRDGLFAYHVETSVGYQIIQKTFKEEEKCGLQELRKSFLPREAPWLVMRKHNPYSELIRIGAKKAIETGFKTRYVRRYYTKKPVCGSKSSRFLTVGVIDCQPAFLFLIYGISISTLVFIAEIIIKRYFNKACPPPFVRSLI